MAVQHRKRHKPATAGSDQAGNHRATGCAAAEPAPCDRGTLVEQTVERGPVFAENELRAEVAELRAQLHAHLQARVRANVRIPREAPGAGLVSAQDDRLHALEGRIQALEGRVAYQEEVARLRLGSLERSQEDQEARLRALADSVARLTTTASLAQIAQAAFALILSAIAAYLGRR